MLEAIKRTRDWGLGTGDWGLTVISHQSSVTNYKQDNLFLRVPLQHLWLGITCSFRYGYDGRTIGQVENTGNNNFFTSLESFENLIITPLNASQFHQLLL